MRKPHVLNDRQKLFVQEYLVDLNSKEAAIRAGYGAKCAAHLGLSRNPHIRKAIDAAMAERAARTQITADQVLRDLWLTATANVNEVIEHRIESCRYCHGLGHRYQMTKAERDREIARAAKRSSKHQGADEDDVLALDEQGGIGFNPNQPPHPECPECHGNGVGKVYVRDTRNLSIAGRVLYAGVKQTRYGMEVKIRDQQAALIMVGKHLGMFPDKHEHTGADGEPLFDANERLAIFRERYATNPPGHAPGAAGANGSAKPAHPSRS